MERSSCRTSVAATTDATSGSPASSDGVAAAAGSRGRRARYLISVSSLNIGRYMEMTIVPTIAPTPIIRIGSMIDVSD